jgi:hypothetical protein
VPQGWPRPVGLHSGWALGCGSKAEPKINDPARDWDHLWNEVIVDITIIGILFAIVTAWFIWQSAAPSREMKWARRPSCRRRRPSAGW